MEGEKKPAAYYLPVVLIVAAVALLVVHFALDAGDDQEAPGWILYVGIFLAIAATLVATTRDRG